MLLAGLVTAALPAAGALDGTNGVRSGRAEVALTATVPAALSRVAPASVRVRVVPGPALVGRPTRLTLQLSAVGAGAVAVTDLLPAGQRYVPGSSRLAPAGQRSRTLPDPRLTTTSVGTLMVWSSVRVSSSGAPTALALSVTRVVLVTTTPVPAGGAADPSTSATSTAGSEWTDVASVYARRAAPAAPSLTAAGLPGGAAGDLASTDAAIVEVVPVAAVQTGRLVAPTSPPAAASSRAARPLEERLVITATPTAATQDVTVRVYLPGRVAWLGGVGRTAAPGPAITEVSLPVTKGQPDQPRLGPVTAGAGGPTRASGAATAAAPFTVLAWRLGTLPAGATRIFTYLLAPAPVAPVRTHDLVTATARMALPAPTKASTAGPARPAPPTKTAAATAAADEPVTSALVPVVGRSPVATVPAAALIRATAVQLWPAERNELTGTPAAADPDISTTTSTSTTTTTAPVPTTPTSAPGDPFVTEATSAATTATTAAAGSTATTAETSAPTATTGPTAPATAAGLAQTGSDVVGTGEAGLGLAGGGVLLLLLSGRGRRRRPRPR